MKVLLISGGAIDDSFAVEFCRRHTFNKIIAVDGGLAVADRIGISPLTDLVGDFDTICSSILQKYLDHAEEMNLKVHRFNPEKDYTDTDIALKLAMSYCKDEKDEIWILGATGTRLDHVLANLTMLLLPYQKGITTWIVDAHNKIRLLSGEMKVRREDQFGKYISLIPLTQCLKGVTLEGVKYPLNNHDVSLGESLLVSNEITEKEARLFIREGIALVLETKD